MRAAQRYRYPASESMPILFENHEILVFENGSGEIFIECKNGQNGRAKLRVTPHFDYLTATAHDGRLTPTSVNGLSAFAVTPR